MAPPSDSLPARDSSAPRRSAASGAKTFKRAIMGGAYVIASRPVVGGPSATPPRHISTAEAVAVPLLVCDKKKKDWRGGVVWSAGFAARSRVSTPHGAISWPAIVCGVLVGVKPVVVEMLLVAR